MASQRPAYAAAITLAFARFAVAGALAVVALLTPSEARSQERPTPLKSYKGRDIAPTMSFHGANWLTRESRNAEENTNRLLRALNVQPGQVVCDMGCGNGYYTIP